jgi:anaerobic selenocysteine-containing dehydrogenase
LPAFASLACCSARTSALSFSRSPRTAPSSLFGPERSEPVIAGGGYDAGDSFEFRLITYRTPEVYCTQGQNLPSLARKRPYNPVLLHPTAMQRLGLSDGDRVLLDSGYGTVEGLAEGSEALRQDVVACAFGWQGTNVQRLIPDDELHDPVSGLARQSALPVNVRRIAVGA